MRAISKRFGDEAHDNWALTIYIKLYYDCSYTILERSTLENDLGILIDCELNFSEQYVCGSKESKWNHGCSKNLYSS